MVLNFKKKICVAALCCFMLTGSAFASVDNTNSIKNIKTSLSSINVSAENINEAEKFFYDLLMQAKYKEAMEVIDYLVNANIKLYGPQTPQTANIYVAKGIFYSDMGIYDVAKNSIDEADKIAQLYPENTDLQNNVYNALFLYYFATNQPYENIKILNKVNPDTLRTEYEAVDLYEKLGCVYMAMQNYKKAEELFNTYYEISNQKLGIDSPNTLQYYQAMMYLSMAKNDFNSFTKYYDKAVSQYERKHSGDLNQLSRNVNAQVGFLIELLDYYLANDILNLYYPIFEESHRTDNIESLYERYADLNKEVSNFSNVEMYLNKIEELQKNIPQKSIKHVKLYEKKYDFYKDSQEPDKACAEIVKALNLVEPVRNYVPEIYGKFLIKAGEINAIKHNFEESYNYFNTVIEFYKKKFPDNSYPFFDAYKIYGEAFANANEYDKATEYYNKALKISTELFGGNDKDSADIYSNLAFAYANKNKKNAAFRNINKTINIYKNIYGKKHIKTYEKIMEKYYICCILSMDKKADKILNSIYTDAKNNEIQGVKKEFYLNLYRNLAYRYLGKNDYENALIFAEKARLNIYYTKQIKEIDDLINEIKNNS